MTQLFINEQQAVLKSGTSFKFTRENPLFSDSGDYTFDVSLPLEGCRQNQRIFGPIHRPEVSLIHEVGQRYPFLLLAPPLRAEGKCVITSVTEQEVKIQMLAKTSQLNLDKTNPDGSDIYIDELNLGRAYEREDKTIYVGDDRIWKNGHKAMYSNFRNRLMSFAQTKYNADWLYGLIGKTDCVNFPIWSTADSKMANDRCLNDIVRTESGVTERKYYFNAVFPSELYISEDHVFAAQPYLVVIIEKVLKALGYEIRANAIRSTWMENIFVANARSEYEFRKILPHWTVKEFMEEIQNFFGVFVEVEGEKVDIIRRAEYYSSVRHLHVLKEVSDERQADLDDENPSKDTTTGNIDYEHRDSDDMLRLPDEVWENAIILIFEDNGALEKWVSAQTDDSKKDSSAWLLVDKSSGKTYAYLCSKLDQKYRLAQVDCCPPLIRDGKQWSEDGRDIGVSLRIVPAKMQMVPIPYVRTVWTGRDRNDHIEENIVQVPMLSTSDSRQQQRNGYSVNDAINPSESNTSNNTTTEKPENIEVAYNPGTAWNYTRKETESKGPESAEIPSPLGIAYVKNDDGYYVAVEQNGNHDEFRLTNANSPSLCASSLSLYYKIDTRCQHIVAFTDRGIPAVGDIFLIRGRRYACAKLEFTVDEYGVQPLKRGYFHEIN